MTILAPPRHPLIEDALTCARNWCAGHEIDAAPALRHAVAVAVVLGRYHPETEPDITAAVLMHDSPEFAPPTLDLDAFLTIQFSPETNRIVRALQHLHDTMGADTEPEVAEDDSATLQAACADKIVAISSMLRRSRTADSPSEFWSARTAFTGILGYFDRFTELAAQGGEGDMAERLRALLVKVRAEANG
ncbi:hypothetical protein [Glycomyces buryatensis]|uniref:HD domain-containing protein n=1 Tax=Glycomyces buryatensis TaxID=2570927 RepID=A0A4S8QAL8_9ACTN|nr:hypothetical protein [Glycomyces buryatensis]THV41378.1 hypothetical protein FAB82_11965 [Glycomyces buryatensis]